MTEDRGSEDGGSEDRGSEDRVVIVGAGGAIGAALARMLAASGARTHLIARGPLPPLDGATVAHADVLVPGALEAAVVAAGPRIAGLAYCVGSITLKPAHRATEEDHLLAYRLNVLGAARAVVAARDGLRAAGGSVVLFSSVAARSGFANHSVTGTVKAAVEGLTVALAAEMAPAVRVNAVAPSLTKSAMAASMTGNEAMAKAIAAAHPIPRLGLPEDAAAMAAFLLSDAASWITGQVFAVDGGRSTLRTKG